MLSTRRPVRAVVSTLVSLALAGCGAGTALKQTIVGAPPQFGGTADVTGFLGAIAADEPEAVTIGKQILQENGTAADAAAAVAFTLAVTLPSRGGLGAGGACVAYSPAAGSANGGVPQAVLFTAPVPSSRSGDRPAAVPMLAAGMFALHARYGALPIARVIAPAEQLARLGVPVSKAFAADLAVVGGALLADPAAQVFGPDGTVLQQGDLLTQTDLASSLARIRVAGAGDLYTGELAATLAAQMRAAGAAVSTADLRRAAPALAAPITVDDGKDRVAFLPPPADGGLAAAAAFQRLQTSSGDLDVAQARALGAASAWRKGADAATALSNTAGAADTIGPLPASTSFVTLDRAGNAVACAETMGNLFGTGRVVPGTGILLAASPAAFAPPLLAAAIAFSPSRHAFRAEIAGSGQEGAALGVAVGMLKTLRGKVAMPSTVPPPGRINAIACLKYLPGNTDQCTWATDPRENGLAVGGS